MKILRITVLGVLVFLMGLLGCTKKKPYEEVEGKQTVGKDAFPKDSLSSFYGLTAEEVNMVKNAKVILEQACGVLTGSQNLSTNQVLKAYLSVVKRIKSSDEGSNTCKENFKKVSSAQDKQRKLNSYISVTSYGDISRSSDASPSFFMGDAQLVKFEMSEHKLEIRGIEKDERFADNPTNTKLLLTIPVKHIDYKCEKDAFGECQNKEVEDTGKDWRDRKFVELSLDELQAHGVDSLPIELSNAFDGCYENTSSKLVDKEIKDGVINIEIERSYRVKAQAGCIASLQSLEDLSFDIRYKYSIVRANLITSGDYEPVDYEREDETKFGFFTTERKQLDVDNNAVEDTDIVLMNRWNPKRKIIPYHLSDSFAKPENDYVLDATLEGIKRVNQGLADSGSNLQIEPIMPSGQKIGDLRNNMVVLVDDPLSSRIIGYGPSVAHPLTGEIVNARTVMYLGTIKTIVKRTYDEIRDGILDEKERAKAIELARKAPALASVVAKLKGHISALFKKDGASSGLGNISIDRNGMQKSINASNILGAKKAKELMATRTIEKKYVKDDPVLAALTPNLAAIKRELSTYKQLESSALLEKERRYTDSRIDKLSRMNVYPEELFNAEFAVESAGIKAQIEDENMPEWADLSDDEQEEVIRLVLPHIWIPTFVHEMGHNLGLRHNFAGSEDRANFYSKEELESMGVGREIPYSSVMDYSYRTMNELPTMGKYDIAALRFGYARLVDVNAVQKDTEGNVIKDKGGNVLVSGERRIVARSLRDMEKDFAKENATLPKAVIERTALVGYEYCTDEYVDANPTCNRFDEGTNYTEITEHFIRSFDHDYDRINRRNGRRDFSLFSEGAYLGRKLGSFYDLRLMFDLHDRIRNEFGIPDSNEVWEQSPFLKDLRNASKLAGQFFLSVILTPDVNCAVSLADSPETPIDVVPLRFLGRNDATTCFHPVVEETLVDIGAQMGDVQLVVVGEGGKSFRTRKDSLNRNPYADQIDVQGIWIDKLLAADLLFAREMGSRLFDSYTNNFLSHPDVGADIIGDFAAILLERGQIDVEFTNAKGRPATFVLKGEKEDETVVTSALPINLSFRDDHLIDVPEVTGLISYFGLPVKNGAGELSHFRKELIDVAVTNSAALIDPSTKKFISTFAVKRNLPNGDDVKEYDVSKINGDNFYAKKGVHQVASVAIQSLAVARLFDGVSAQLIKTILELKKQGKPLPAGVPANLQLIYKLDIATIEAFVNGVIKEPDFYEQLLYYLPVA